MVSVSAESPPRFLQCLLRFCHLPLLTSSPPLRLLATCPVLLSPKSFNVTPVSHQFSLISGFVKWLLSKTEVQLLILGIDHAGKTTLLEQMKGVFEKTEGLPLDKIPPT